MKHNLKTLEKTILKYYVRKGYVVGEGTWGFEITTKSTWKDKRVCVVFTLEGVDQHYAYTGQSKKLDKLFEDAIKFFKTKTKEIVYEESEYDCNGAEYKIHKN